MFRVGDTVSYSTQGVCRIIAIERLKLTDKSEEYYVLKPIYQEASKIYIPINNDKLTAKMRRVLSKAEIIELIKVMPDSEAAWIDNDIERKEKYSEILSSGDRRRIAALIKALYLKQNERRNSGKRLRQSDEAILSRAQALLYDEFALVLDIKPDQVVPFLNEQIGIDTLDKNI